MLARDGYEVENCCPSGWLQRSRRSKQINLAGVVRANGKRVVVGSKRTNRALATFLAAFAKDGPSAFYEGESARAIVNAVASQGGILTVEDLARYKPKWREPLYGTYRGIEVITMPPPSSGGVALLETLNILEHYYLLGFGPGVEYQTILIEALKHAFADRARWLGDADFVEVPVQRLVSKSYAAELQRRIRPWTVGPLESYGTAAPPKDDHGTSHVSIIDRAGNMLACTSTVNTSFGSMVAVPELGIVMNNQMDDFSAQPGVPNSYGLIGNEQNAIAPGKRPLSSMSPTLLLRGGKPFMAVGASGGPTIITGTLQAIVRVVDFNMSAQDAVSLPRLHAQWLPDLVFMEAADETTKNTLEKRGHRLKIGDGFTAVQVVVAREGVYEGASDPRKKGQPAAPTN
ncbi:MAG: gamma-glutamyltransferase [bacterium]